MFLLSAADECHHLSKVFVEDDNILDEQYNTSHRTLPLENDAKILPKQRTGKMMNAVFRFPAGQALQIARTLCGEVAKPTTSKRIPGIEPAEEPECPDPISRTPRALAPFEFPYDLAVSTHLHQTETPGVL